MTELRHTVASIERIVGSEVGRCIQRMVNHTQGNLFNAAGSVTEHPHPKVGILTGFWIPACSAPETDGPVGAALMAAGLRANGVEVNVITDRYCSDVVSAACKVADEKLPPISIYTSGSFSKSVEGLTHCISIERAGPTAAGRVHNMSGDDITDTTPNLHDWYSMGPWVKIAIGDGGNEVGMGSLPPEIISDVAHGNEIACTTPCDHLIVAGVSNWGAWGLLAAWQLLQPNWNTGMALDADRAEAVLRSCVAAGAVDGVTKQRAITVDGIAWKDHVSILYRILNAYRAWEEYI